MTAEQLNIVVKLNTSDVEDKINQINTNIKNTNKTITNSVGAATSATSAAAAQSATAIKTQLSSLIPGFSMLTQQYDKIKAGAVLAGQSNYGWLKQTYGSISQAKKAYSALTKETAQYTAELEKTKNAITAIYSAYAKTQGFKFNPDINYAEDEKFADYLRNNSQIGDIYNDLIEEEIDLSKKTSKLQKQTGDLSQAFSTLGSEGAIAFAAVAAAVAVAVAAVVKISQAIIKLVNQVSEIGDTIDKTSQRLQMSNQQYQRWDYVMNLCGSSAEELKEIISPLTAKIRAADKGTAEAVSAFKDLGVVLYDDNGKLRDMEAIFNDTVIKLQSIQSATERAVKAQEIFGETSSKIAVLLNMSAEQMAYTTRVFTSLGLAMNDSTVQMSAAYQDIKYTLSSVVQSIKNTLGEILMPLVIQVVRWITVALAYVNIVIKALFGLDLGASVADRASKSMNNYSSSVGDASAAVKELKRQTMGFDEMNIMQSQSSGSYTTGIDLGDLESELTDTSDLFSKLIPEETLNKIDKFREKIAAVQTKIHGCGQVLGGFLTMLAGIGLGNTHLFILGIDKIIDGLGTLFGFDWDAVKTKVSNSFTAIATGIHIACQQGREKIKQFIIDAPELLAKVKDKVFSWFSKLITGTDTKWKDFSKHTKSGCATLVSVVNFSGIYTKLKNLWTNMKTYYKNSIAPKFTKAYWTNKFDGIKNGAKNAFNGIIGIAQNAINYIIRKLNKLSWKLPDWIPGVGGKQFGFNLKEIYIPRLAKGGIVQQSTLINAGEQGREAILPLENNTGWMDALADRLAARSKTPSKIVLMLDKKELGYANINSINDITKQTGKLQLKLG